MEIGTLIGLAVGVAIVSYLNEKMIREHKEKEEKEKLLNLLKEDIKLEPKEINKVEKKPIKKNKKND